MNHLDSHGKAHCTQESSPDFRDSLRSGKKITGKRNGASDGLEVRVG